MYLCVHKTYVRTTQRYKYKLFSYIILYLEGKVQLIVIIVFLVWFVALRLSKQLWSCRDGQILTGQARTSCSLVTCVIIVCL